MSTADYEDDYALSFLDENFMSIMTLLNRNVPIGEIASAIDKYGVYTWDQYGRFIKAEKGNDEWDYRYVEGQGYQLETKNNIWRDSHSENVALTLLELYRANGKQHPDAWITPEDPHLGVYGWPIDLMEQINFSEVKTTASRVDPEGSLSDDLNTDDDSGNHPGTSEDITSDIEKPLDNSENITGNSKYVVISNEELSTFDPVSLSGIAKMFRLNPDDEQNIEMWKKHAEKASENGLKKARVSVSRGSEESTFDPELVGDWLVYKQRTIFTRAKINNILRKNLPKRSKDKEDFYSN